MAMPPQAEAVLQFSWPGITQQFILDSELPRDLAGIGDYLRGQHIWPILNALEPFSYDWHQMLAAISPLIMTMPETGQSAEEREIIAQLKDILGKYNAAGWHGVIDGFDGKRVTGWAMRSSDSASQHIDVYLNGSCIQHNLNAASLRPDVKSAGFGNGLYGFGLPVPDVDPERSIFAFSLRDPHNGSVFAFRLYRLEPGKVEYETELEITPAAIHGSCLTPDYPDRSFNIDIFLDDVFFIRARAGKHYISLPNPAPCLAPGFHNLQIRYPNGLFSKKFHFETASINVPAIYDPYILEKPAAIIIPITKDDIIEAEWLENLFQHTPETAAFIFVAEEVSSGIGAGTMERMAKRQCKIITVKNGAGFGSMLNAAMAEAGGADIVILRPYMHIPPRWLANMRITACAAVNIASVSACPANLLGRYPFNMPEDARESYGASETLAAACFGKMGYGYPLAIQSGDFDCLYITKEFIQNMGGFVEGADARDAAKKFFSKVEEAGRLNLLDTNAIIFSKKDEISAIERAVLNKEGAEREKQGKGSLRDALWQMALAAWRLRKARGAHVIKPRAMYALSTSIGGTPRFNDDLVAGLKNQIDAYALYCDTKSLRLFRYKNGAPTLLFEHCLDEIVDQVSHISHEYNAVILSWLAALDIDIVHIQALIWHSLGLMEMARDYGCKIVMNIHDFYAISPNLNLVDDAGVFLGKNYICQGSPYRTQLWQKPFPLESPAFRRFWRKRFHKYLRLCDALVMTDSTVREILLESMKDFGGLLEEKIHLIPHGSTFSKFYNYGASMRPNEKLRILIPGNIGFHKGMGVILALAAYDEAHENMLEFHIVGDCSIPTYSPAIIKHGKYGFGELPAHIDQIRPHAAAFFSIWNEIWCYTLSEAWGAGLPTFVLNYPTMAARLQDARGGWLLEFDDIPEIYAAMLAALRDSEKMGEARANVRQWQKKMENGRGIEDMGREYFKIYAESTLLPADNGAMPPTRRRKLAKAPLIYLHAAGCRGGNVKIVLEALRKLAKADAEFEIVAYGYEEWMGEYGIDNKFSHIFANAPLWERMLPEIAACADFAIFPDTGPKEAKPVASALGCLGLPVMIAARKEAGVGEWRQAIQQALAKYGGHNAGDIWRRPRRAYQDFQKYIDEIRNH